MRRLALLTALLAVALCGAARADTTVMGSLNLPATGTAKFLNTGFVDFQLAAGDANYVVQSPVTGLITSWSFRQAALTPGEQLELRVLTPQGGTSYRVVATSETETVDGTGDVVRTFPESPGIAIQAGEVLGLQSVSGGDVPVFATVPTADEKFLDGPNLTDGASSTYTPDVPSTSQLLVQATIDFVPSTTNPPPTTPPPPAIPPTQQLGSLAPPVEGKNVNIARVSGTVLVRLPGTKTFVPLALTGQQVPVGSDVDVTNGRITMVAANAPMGPVTKTSDFYGGVFRVSQPASGKGRVDLKLDGPLSTCKTFTSRSARSAKAKGKPKSRFVWGDGHGTFRTVGQSGSAAVRGTKWEVVDRCDGSTLVVVARGIVAVTDTVRHKTVLVKAGHSKLIRPRH